MAMLLVTVFSKLGSWLLAEQQTLGKRDPLPAFVKGFLLPQMNIILDNGCNGPERARLHEGPEQKPWQITVVNCIGE
jgi:hypothetical protein